MYSHALKSLQNAPSGRLDVQNIFKTIFKDYCYQVYEDLSESAISRKHRS